MQTYDSPDHNACVRQTGKETVCFICVKPGAALSADGVLGSIPNIAAFGAKANRSRFTPDGLHFRGS